MQRTLYLIATTSRSGSTHLCRMLAATKRLGEPAEYYNVRVRPLRMQLCGAASDADYFQQVVSRTSTPNGVCQPSRHGTRAWEEPRLFNLTELRLRGNGLWAHALQRPRRVRALDESRVVLHRWVIHYGL